ncbi:Rv2175c family DNA-binding protein [Zafaria sp. J156]|nr:Rv2175c family DNA-binding protein [Zafaria sp. J156]MEE1620301.1 Rv2175c family DNA-binding protein [Zafaria sp. J156]
MSTLEERVSEWLSLPEAAEQLGLPLKKVHSLIDDRSVVAHRIGDNKIRAIPAAFIQDGHLVDSLKGTITVLVDSGFSGEELLAWLFTEDESLGGSPIQALREGRKTEIRRRAQALAW